jgi:hypothetical protein
MRSFNVFSELVVVWPGEQFNWVVNQDELGSGTSAQVTVSPSSLLTPVGPYIVTPATPVSATASATPGQGTITCNPVAPGIATQTIIVAAVKADICGDVSVDPGDHFIWENKQTSPVLVSPDPTNDAFWPLPDQEHWVPANGWLVAQIPADAKSGMSYTLQLTMNGKAFSCSPMAAQPKIIVGSGK